MTKNLYDVLGVNKTTSQEDIKKAYRKLTKKLHPDLNPGDKGAEKRFKSVSAAYDILGKPDQRSRYDGGEIDESGVEKPQQQYYRQYADAGGKNAYHSSAGYEDMGDVFSQMFGARAQSATARGQDARYHMDVSFREAALGGTKQVQMADGAKLNVSIPKGIENGKTIRLKGKGQPGFNGGPAGDALIQITVLPDPIFIRNGLNIDITLPITLDEAALGGKVEVPTLHGAVGVSIPAGASSGKTLRLKGRGIESSSGKKGDQLVTISVQLPDKIDKDLEAFLKDWRKKHPYDPRKKLKGATHV